MIKMRMLSKGQQQWSMVLLLFFFLTTTSIVTTQVGVVAAPLEDLVAELPGYGRTPTPHFSGYLDATAGCNTQVNGEYCKLHYWLALAESDTASDHDDAAFDENVQYDVIRTSSLADLSKPVVLWLNGGPGSSSILGFLTENGPLLMNATGGLMENPWSWTKVAHVMALEAPVGVGYSYCAKQKKLKERQEKQEDAGDFSGDDDVNDHHDKDDNGVCQNTDKFTASASRAALQDFFTNKFPELRHNEFYITGESYAGIYIPTLSKEILDHAKDDINLVGIAVGDPCTDNTAQQDSMDSLWYSNKYGLMDEQAYDLLWNQCWARFPNLMTRGGKHLVAAILNRQVQQEILKMKLHNRNASNSGDVLDDKDIMALFSRRLLEKLSTDPGPLFKESDECRLAARKFLLSSSHALSQGWGDLYIDDYSLFAPVTSQEEDDMATYMMRDDVRAALHVQDAPTTSWPYADVGFDYTKEYDACNDEAADGAWSMIDFYKDIVPRLKTTFIYNGDTDPCVSYEGTRTAVKRIGFAEIDGGSYRPWFYNQTAASIALLAEKAPLFGPNLLAQSVGAQLGGEVVNYENGLSFLTVHGSGHMVPQFRPQAALHMLVKLLQKEKGLLSPLLPSNKTLIEMNEFTFQDAMDAWTVSAMAEPYVCSSSSSSSNAAASTSSTKKEDSRIPHQNDNKALETAIKK